MTDKEKTLAAYLLQMASEDFSNNSCNDVDEAFYDGWTHEERVQFVKEYYEWNGSPEDFNEDYLHIDDYALMKFLAHKLHN